VLRLLAEGRTMKQVAESLQITVRTVAFHKYRIMKEFELKTNPDLVRFAIKERLISIS
jgi:DNA-binding CsgD family transcriptional regulator